MTSEEMANVARTYARRIESNPEIVEDKEFLLELSVFMDQLADRLSE